MNINYCKPMECFRTYDIPVNERLMKNHDFSHLKTVIGSQPYKVYINNQSKDIVVTTPWESPNAYYEKVKYINNSYGKKSSSED